MLTQAELDRAPKAVYAGKEYPMPLLVPRQQRIVFPKLMNLMMRLTINKVVNGVQVEELSPVALTTQLYDDMVEITHLALTRGTPSLTLEEFMDMEVNLFELIAGIQVIAGATGLMRKKKVGETVEPSSGEA